ncbi:LysR family transcriptional regulator [Enterococcus alishanensis]|uniref:LysR family transcriptional regulator n=1 Tax=Enterococcus alishanensis TaxID=1303817 RepID=A0ABS6TEU4_9ENTE|nr:LysR family transcriptional regulator [Enterococcus alishanensis]MBV7391456.1 LysR family transcriptional regulator [Enterococcus alishanensis]
MFKYLETFKVVYETKNFSKAAELLFVAQPTVSAQIKQLENELGVTLFIRNGRKEILTTPQAELLYEKGLMLLEDWEILTETLKQQENHQLRAIIGASHTFAVYLLPDLLMQLKKLFPKISFTIKMMNSLEVIQALEHHEIDFGFIEKPLSAKNLLRFPLIEDQLVVAGDLEQGPWLVREKTSGVAYYTHRFLAENDIQQEQIVIESNEVIVSLLKKGFGCSLISKRAAADLNYESLSEKYIRHFYLVKREPPLPIDLNKVFDWIRLRGFAENKLTEN